MATTSSQAFPSLAPEQQKLLMAALASNKQRRAQANDTNNGNNVVNGQAQTNASNGVNPAILTSNSIDQYPPSHNLSASDANFGLDFSTSMTGFGEPFPDILDGANEGEQGEKRKSPEDDEDDDEDNDTGEPGAKEAKKPGRKLITAEPTTKRKAQNRAAQRAFRERKEKHLKDLETKVGDLEKASESANHENSVLRVQVERLQEELKDYRRRMSGTNNSPTSARPSLDGHRSFGSPNLDFDFNFDIPKFGSVPGSVMPSTQAIQGSSTQQPQQQNSVSSMAFDDNANNGFLSHHNSVSSMSNGQSQPTPNGSLNGSGSSIFGTGFFDGLGNKTQSPGPINNTRSDSVNGTLDRPSPCNTTSSSSRSPASHNSNGPSSSCCTSPDSNNDWTNIYSGNKTLFNAPASIGGASYNTNNTPGLTNVKTPNSDNFSLDFLANQNGGQFDPVLFGEYRDTQNAIVGDDAFTGGFFEEGISFPDFNDPFNFNLASNATVPAPVLTNGVLNQMQQSPMQKKKPNLMDQVAQQQEANYTGAPTENDLPMPEAQDYNAPNLMMCHKIWNQLQNCPRFQSGDFDVDVLCAELSSKAKCTTTGVAVPKETVEAALWKLAGNPFEDSSTDKAQQANTPQDAKSTQSKDYEAKHSDAKAEATRRFQQFMAKSGTA